MNPYNQVLLKMNAIEENNPIACEYESDARYTWPVRWEMLRKQVSRLASQSGVAADGEYSPFGPEWEKEMMRWTKEELVAELRRRLT